MLLFGVFFFHIFPNSLLVMSFFTIEKNMYFVYSKVEIWNFDRPFSNVLKCNRVVTGGELQNIRFTNFASLLLTN